MDFGYFTLSDNHYDNNTRDANQFVADIVDEALYADEARHALGLDRRASFQLARRAVVSRTWRWPMWRRNTKRIRLAPAVTVLPLHHPIRVAEQWATLDLLSGGRVDFAAGAATTGANTCRSTCRSTRTRRSSRRAWRSCAACGRRTSASRITASIIQFDDVRITPKPVQRPLPTYVGLVLQAVDRACRAAGLRPHRGAVRRGDDLWRARSRWPSSTTRPAPSTARSRSRLMCSYFTHFADTQAQEDAQPARARSATTRNA